MFSFLTVKTKTKTLAQIYWKLGLKHFRQTLILLISCSASSHLFTREGEKKTKEKSQKPKPHSISRKNLSFFIRTFHHKKSFRHFTTNQHVNQGINLSDHSNSFPKHIWFMTLPLLNIHYSETGSFLPWAVNEGITLLIPSVLWWRGQRTVTAQGTTQLPHPVEGTASKHNGLFLRKKIKLCHGEEPVSPPGHGSPNLWPSRSPFKALGEELLNAITRSHLHAWGEWWPLTSS